MKKRIARRQFIKENLAATALAVSSLNRADAQSQIADKAGYRGPLSEFDLADRNLDSLPFTLSTYDSIKPAMSFNANNQAAARAWQITARRKLVELLGGFPARNPLQPRILETKKINGYTREKVIFQSRDSLSVFGYLLLPEKLSGPTPAVVCLPGHGRGCDDIVGIDENGRQRENKAGYSRDFALQVVENG